MSFSLHKSPFRQVSTTGSAGLQRDLGTASLCDAAKNNILQDAFV